MNSSPAELIDLTGRVVVVTGAGGGIGAGIVGRMAAAGASVVAHTRSSAVDQSGGEVVEVRADLTDNEGPAAVVSAAREHFGCIDALVNNAGIQPVAPFTELDDQQWCEMLDTNLTAVHRLTQVAASAMRDQGTGGSIVHVASIEAQHPTPVHGHYATSKAGLVMHAKAAALAWGSHGIRVNSVSPGLIDRPGLAEDWSEGVERWMAAVPLGRMGTPEDVGDACVFLCSDLSRWITGADLVVDGGILTNPTW